MTAGPAAQVQDPILAIPRRDSADQLHGAACVFLVAVRIQGMILLPEPLLEPFCHSTKTSAVKVKTSVAGSRQLRGPSPAFSHTASRNASMPNPCSVATCGNRTACA